MARRFLFLLLSTLFACESPSSTLDAGPPRDGGRPDGAAPDGGAGGDGGLGSDGSVDDGGGPILERPSSGALTCTQRSLRFLARGGGPFRYWGESGHSVAEAGGQVFLARVERESTTQDPFCINGLCARSFRVSTLGADGSLGAPLELRAGHEEEVLSPTLLSFGTGLVLLWTEGSQLGFARLDASGALAHGPVMQPLAATAFGVFSAAVDGDRLAVAVRIEGSAELRMWILDGQGARVAGPIDVGRPPELNYYTAHPALVGTGDGFALLWAERRGEASELHFGRFDRAGAPRGAPRMITAPDPERTATGEPILFGPNPPALLRRPGGFLAAWGELYRGHTPPFDSGAHGLVRVAKLGDDGEVLGAREIVRAKVVDQEESEPTLVPFGERVLLSVARGTIIYACGGCVPDHVVDNVVLDPDRLAPASNVLRLTPEAGGLLRRRVAVSGGGVFMSLDDRFHVHSEPAVATFECR